MDDDDLPIVTVLGGGIAGLTAAHELVERGFKVQVVESLASGIEEYQGDVGGLAANQFTRVRAPLAHLHDGLSDEDKQAAKKFRNGLPIEDTSRRFPILQTIRFDKRVHVNPPQPQTDDDKKRTPREPPPSVAIPADWQAYWDEYGTLSSRKLGDVLKTIRQASETYMQQYFPALAQRLATGTPPDDTEWTQGHYTDVAPGDPAAGRRFVAREILKVQIIGYTDTDGTPDQNRIIARYWAGEVRDALIALNDERPPDLQIWQLKDMLDDPVAMGSANPYYDQATPEGRKRSNRVEFRTVEQTVPGEHGFRFFPAFYRHLFDTMRRTPLFDQAGHLQSATAFDQLVPTPDSEIARKDGTGPRPFQVRRIRSLRRLDDMLMYFLNDLEMTQRDLLGLQFFTLRYMMSGSGRRQHEAEPISFIDYIQTIGGPGPAPDGTPPKSRFSPKALAFIDQAPRALAAMSASESDARTQFDIAAQLMMMQPDGPADDLTLNGPTTTAWLDHWKTYLKRQGVEFFAGEVFSLRLKGNRLVPVFVERDPNDHSEPSAPDLIGENPNRSFRFPKDAGKVDRYRYVLATSFQHTSALIWDALLNVGGDPAAFAGPFGQLINFDTNSNRRTIGDGETLREPKRDPATGKPPELYPLRTISGLQYFFTEQYRFGRGNVFFVETPWALTSISQFPYWRRRVEPVGPLLGQITVDLGNWHNPYPTESQDKAPGHPAWYSSRQEIANKTWSQVKEGLPDDYAQLVKPPAYFHIDRNIVFAEYSRSAPKGSALFRPVQTSEGLLERPKFPTIEVLGSSFGPPIHPVDQAEIKLTAATFINWVAEQFDQRLFTVEVPQPETARSVGVEKEPVEGAADVLLAPRDQRQEFTILFRGSSTRPFYIAIDHHPLISFIVAESASRFEQLRSAVREVDDSLVVIDLEAPGHATFKVRREDGHEFVLGVANADGAIELVNGPVLKVQDFGNVARLLDAQVEGFCHVTLAAVRCNAVLTLPAAILPGLTYKAALDIGVGNPVDPDLRFTYTAASGDTAEAVRNAIMQQMRLAPSKLLVEPLDAASLVVSPVSLLNRAVVSFLGTSATPILLYVAGQEITLDAGAKPMTDRRDELAGQLVGFEVTVIDPGGGPGTGALSIVATGEASQFLIGVLNLERLIELVGAPALTLRPTNIVLEQPTEGFVVLRNDAEYLVNVPGEFSSRPGLLRGNDKADIPDGYPDLAALFGNAETEIYSGHPDASLLQNWVTAGTYMATYTRITTMESANESGRHAAAALIFKELADAKNAPLQRTLVADLPQIWKVEENELDDLKFYTDLDESLFAAGLPHVLDILSLTPLIGMLLEADLHDDQVRTFLQKLKAALDTSSSAASQAIKSGAQLLSLLADAYVDLAKGVIGPVTGTDPASKALNNLLQQIGEARQSFKSIWGD